MVSVGAIVAVLFLRSTSDTHGALVQNAQMYAEAIKQLDKLSIRSRDVPSRPRPPVEE